MGSLAMPSPQQPPKTSPFSQFMPLQNVREKLQKLPETIVRVHVEALSYEEISLMNFKRFLEYKLRDLTEHRTQKIYTCRPLQGPDVYNSEQHCSYTFHMELQKKRTCKDGMQFNIDAMFTEFVHQVKESKFWKPGMKISVSCVPREQIPSVLAKGIGCESPERSNQDQRGGNCSQGALDFLPQSC